MFARSNTAALVLLLVTVFMLVGCGGGGGSSPNPDGIRPSITSLSRTSADIGDTFNIIGLNFGDSQSGGSASLNGVDFQINQWTDTAIDVTVSSGMTSGIVVVSVDGLESQSGAVARLFIPVAPTGNPVINAINPNFGWFADEVMISGQGFGTDQGAGNVIFADGDGNETVAEVITVDVDGTPVAQWGENLIKAAVPDVGPGNYSIYVSTGTALSNAKGFLKVAEIIPIESPIIIAVTPGNGAVGTSITISGVNFGHSQGTSNLTIGGVALDIVAWSDAVINALIPNDAETGPLTITVGDHPPYTWTGGDFVVANAPVITGVTPEGVRMSQPLTIYGTHFGTSQGGGTVTVGGTEQTVSEWHPTNDDASINVIIIPSLAPFTASGVEMTDGDGETILDDFGNPVMFYEVVITADNGLASEAEHVYLVTNLQAVVTVDPLAGQRDGDGDGEDGTVFSFRTEVSGGSGNYEYTLIPDASQMSVTAGDRNPATAVIEYTYPYSSGAPDDKKYSTMMRIEDLDNGDVLTVDGPQIRVVNYGVPVITKMGVHDFNQADGYVGPNVHCYLPLGNTYHDFTYLNDNVYFTSSRGGITVGGDEVGHYVRRLPNFMLDGGIPRAQGYRYFNDDATGTNDGAIIAVQGLNFGAATGSVTLNATNAAVPVQNFAQSTDLPTGWSDTEIRFFIPPGTNNLSGTLRVTPAEGTQAADGYEYLTCSPYITNLAPGEGSSAPLDTGKVTLTGFDLSPLTVADKIGTEEYSIWMVVASYTDPWTSAARLETALLTTPVAPSFLDATNMQFDVAGLDIDGDGVVPIEVQNASATETQVVDGVLAEGDYTFFLWTGAITTGTNYAEMAYSGIFSEAYTVKIGPGGGTGEDPVASLSANPTSAAAAPLDVTFDAGASTDDGAIVDYEWDFDGDNNYGEAGDEASAAGDPGPHVYTYTADGTYTARVRVTDDDGNTDIATATITIGTGPESSITVNIFMRDWEDYPTTAETMVRLYDGVPDAGGSPIQQYSLNHREVGEGNPVTCVFEDLPAGGNYYLRCQNSVMHWDGDEDPEAKRDFGPYAVPPSQIIDLNGFQYRLVPDPTPGS